MDKTLRDLMLRSEDALREAVRTEPVISKVYDIGLQNDLSYTQMALLALPFLLNEVRRLRPFEFALSNVARTERVE